MCHFFPFSLPLVVFVLIVPFDSSLQFDTLFAFDLGSFVLVVVVVVEVVRILYIGCDELFIVQWVQYDTDKNAVMLYFIFHSYYLTLLIDSIEMRDVVVVFIILLLFPLFLLFLLPFLPVFFLLLFL